MGEGHKRRSIDEMIEHMNADFQSSDGHYIQLGFTPPVSVSPPSWSESYVPNQANSPQLHSYQSNHVHPVFLRELPTQYKASQQNPHPIPHNVEVSTSFFHVQPSPPNNSESMTCENHIAGLPFVNPGQPPRTLGGFVPYQRVPDQPPSRNYNLFGEGQAGFGVPEQGTGIEHWSTTQKTVPDVMVPVKNTEGKEIQTTANPSSRQAELINNLVGQWAPTSSGQYNPFGDQSGTRRNSNLESSKDLPSPSKSEVKGGKGVPVEKSKRRGVAETKLVRPSYSDVLSKTPPNKTFSSPSLINKSLPNPAGMVPESKGKTSTGGTTRFKNGGRKGGLRRQYSSGSDEQVVSSIYSKLHLPPDGGANYISRCGGHGDTSKQTGETISRRWVSLDDLECGSKGVEESESNENSDKDQKDGKNEEMDDLVLEFTSCVNNSVGADHVRKTPKGFNQTKAGGTTAGGVEETGNSNASLHSQPATLNNCKASAIGNSAGKFQGSSGAKRPLHINNNLGTSGFWASAGQLAGEKNILKGSNSVGGIPNSKNCKACSEERKATSASSGSGSSKSNGGESGKAGGSATLSSRGRGGGSSSSGGGGGGQGAPQPPLPPERSSREPQLGKRGQRNRRREGQQPLIALCRTARNHVIRWGSIVLQALLWFLHLLSDILSLSSHLIWNICNTLWEWLGVTCRKFTCVFQDSFLPWFSSSPKSGASKKRSSSIGSSVPRWRICAWIFRLWKGSVRWCWKTNWKFRSWLGRRGWWGGVEGSFEDWDHDEDEDSDGVPFGREKSGNRKGRGKFGFHHPGSLECNISLPSTGEEAMKRLLACKGKDPYSILGVTPNCSDDDVKKYYKRQAFLVHPDKNGQPGAEEAFKILVHAFDLIGEPEKRLAYDRRVVETRQAEHAWSEFSDLLSQLQEKMAEAANTIRCTNCGKRHRRISVPRPCYAARLCSQCKIHHAAREGDIWAESSMFGFLWHYYACMEGAIYDITEWATCQGDNLRHLRPNSHNVQYRILLGKRGTNGGNGGGSSPTAPAGGPSHSSNNSRPARSSESPSEPDLDHFLNNLYSGGGMGGNSDSSLRQEQSRKRKGKRKK